MMPRGHGFRASHAPYFVGTHPLAWSPRFIMRKSLNQVLHDQDEIENLLTIGNRSKCGIRGFFASG